MSERKTCFVIAPIGEPESPTRKRSDQVLKYIIAPAANECGYDTIRADELSKPGIITNQVTQRILDDPLVIADLTGRNPNVFYELAIRHMVRKPLVQIIQKGEPIPFDVAATRIIQVDHRDLDSVEGAKNEIVKQIAAVEKDPSEIDTPISVAVDLQTLRHGDPEQRSIADIVEVISDLRTEVSSLERAIRSSGFRADAESFYERARMMRSVTPQAEGQLVIDSARYGAEGKYNDVTNVVKSAVVAGQRVELPVNNDYFRPDPIKGVPKELIVTYFYAGRKYSKTIPEGATLLLP
jgi:hypothetical protein